MSVRRQLYVGCDNSVCARSVLSYGRFHSLKSESRVGDTTGGRTRKAIRLAMAGNMLKSGIRYYGAVVIAQVAGFFVQRGKPIP